MSPSRLAAVPLALPALVPASNLVSVATGPRALVPLPKAGTGSPALVLAQPQLPLSCVAFRPPDRVRESRLWGGPALKRNVVAWLPRTSPEMGIVPLRREGQSDFSGN